MTTIGVPGALRLTKIDGNLFYLEKANGVSGVYDISTHSIVK